MIYLSREINFEPLRAQRTRRRKESGGRKTEKRRTFADVIPACFLRESRERAFTTIFFTTEHTEGTKKKKRDEAGR